MVFKFPSNLNHSLEIIFCCSWKECAGSHPLALGSGIMGSLQDWWSSLKDLPICSTRLLPGFGHSLATVPSFPLPCPVPLQAVLRYEMEAFCLLGDPRLLLMVELVSACILGILAPPR